MLCEVSVSSVARWFVVTRYAGRRSASTLSRGVIAASTRSEIVVPVFDGAGALVAVLDVDSDAPAAFDAGDAAALERLMAEVFGRRGSMV